MPKKVDITPDVRAVLERGSWQGATYILPPGQLARDLYQAVNKVLVALGGKWDRRSGGHLFQNPDQNKALRDALISGTAIDQKRTMEQFFTPPAIARQLVDMMGLPHAGIDHVLEPSAGDGALVQALNEIAVPFVTMIEADRDLATGPLAAMIASDRRLIWHDFLSWRVPDGFPPIDAVAMNPPFGNGADIDHVTKAFSLLRPGGVLGAIMSPHWTFASNAKAKGFCSLIADYCGKWHPLPEGSFRPSGTGVNTGILIITKGAN